MRDAGMSDAALEIKNGLEAVWPEITWLTCYSHMMRAWRAVVKARCKEDWPDNDDESKQARTKMVSTLIQMVRDLHECADVATLQTALELFRTDLGDERMEDLYDYFEKQWIEKCPNWSRSVATEGEIQGEPSVNSFQSQHASVSQCELIQKS